MEAISRTLKTIGQQFENSKMVGFMNLSARVYFFLCLFSTVQATSQMTLGSYHKPVQEAERSISSKMEEKNQAALSEQSKSKKHIQKLKAHKNIGSSKSLQWKFTLGNDQIESLTDSENKVTASIGAEGKLELTKMLSVEADFSIGWETGRAQGWYGSDSYENGVNFSKAQVNIVPLSFFQTQIGALNMGEYGQELLLSGTPFPGAKVSLVSPFKKNVQLELASLYAIPTSRSLNSDRIEKEETPTLVIHSLEIGTGTRFDLLWFEGQFGLFQYENLPSKVAYKSSTQGNTVLGGTEVDSRFGFEHAGTFIGFSGGAKLSRWFGFELGYKRIENTKVESGLNLGEKGYIKPVFSWREHSIATEFYKYYNEPDSSVAYYNSSSLGHNNREGFGVGLTYKHGNVFSISTEYISANLIYDSIDNINSDTEIFKIELITSYDQF